MKNIRE